mmetsp:Transcript_20604/g.23889  ORF Transcript_20604/g.23889 Transcript_20604/m.23889 type:complete len:144 (-) Transcript_20604:204-635(-)
MHGSTALIVTLHLPYDFVKYRALCRQCAVLLLQAGANPILKDSDGMSAEICFEVTSTHKQQLGRLVRKSRMTQFEPSFWKSDEVKEFIGADDDHRQCQTCLVYSYMRIQLTGQKHSNFKSCARCLSVYYCSRECQKKHGKSHK